MHFHRNLRLVIAALLVLPTALGAAQGVAQELTIRELINGERFPGTIKPVDLPATFRAIALTHSGNAGTEEVGFTTYSPYSSYYYAPSVPGVNGPATPFFHGLLKALEAHWTDGTVVNLSGEPFLVVYRLSYDASRMMEDPGATESALRASSLRLTLVKVRGVQSLTPMPDLTKQSLLETLGLTDGARPSEASAKSVTLARGKQIALALIMYLNDNDEVLPFAQSTQAVKYVTEPYSKSKTIWNSQNPNGGGFRFNINLGGVSMTALDAPSETPMVYESQAWPDGGRVVAFADGHEAYVDRARWQALQPMLKRKFPRQGRPLPLNYGAGWQPSK
jgi:hypothetical protein